MTQEKALETLKTLKQSLKIARESIEDLQANYIQPLKENCLEAHDTLALFCTDESLEALMNDLFDMRIILETMPIEQIEG